jgi:hypothetical protein
MQWVRRNRVEIVQTHRDKRGFSEQVSQAAMEVLDAWLVQPEDEVRAGHGGKAPLHAVSGGVVLVQCDVVEPIPV